jgi:exonuclease SbcC
MKITLKKLILVNFKGIKSLEIDFSDVTVISGRNKAGKSTLFDAFTWILFGKNAQDQKAFGIKTYDSNGVVIPKLDHEVHAILDIDGVETKLSSILKELWTKKRGEETPELTGHETKYFVNDVPYQAGEYQKYISSIIPEQTFKLLTSPTYFNSLKWNEAREMLITIVGSPTDEEIAGKDLTGLLKIMADEKKTIEQMKKEYAAKKLKLKAELTTIPSRIDEVSRATPQPQDWKKIDGEINTHKLEIAVIEAEISDKSKGIEDAIRTRSHLLLNKANLETQLQKIEFEAKQEFSVIGSRKEMDVKAKKQQILSLRQEVLNYQQDIKTAQGRIDDLNKQNAELRQKWIVKNAESLVWEEGTLCPTCGQSLPDDLVEHKMQEAEQQFNKSKTTELQTISTYGNQNKTRIAELEQNIKKYDAEIAIVNNQIEVLENQLKDIESRPALSKSVEAMLTENEQYIITKQKISEILVPETIHQPDTSELQNRKAEIQNEINNLVAVLASKEMIDTNNKRKAELSAQEKEYAQQIASMEKIEFQIEQFTKRKVTEVERRVNELFPTVRFRMFDPNINGGETPDCICMVDGVPYRDVNNADRINSGVEIINVFSQVHGITAPVFIDNAESINQVIPSHSQIIKLYVTEDEKLTVTN